MTGTASAQQPATKFWGFAGIGVLVMVLAWSWYGLAHLEAETDQGKALTAGTTMEGFAFAVGGIPLIAAHLIGAAILLPLGRRHWSLPGLAYGILAVAAASLLGMGAGQMLFGGDLFELGLGRYSGDEERSRVIGTNEWM